MTVSELDTELEVSAKTSIFLKIVYSSNFPYLLRLPLEHVKVNLLMS